MTTPTTKTAILLCLTAAGGIALAQPATSGKIGRVDISTLSIPAGHYLKSATYTPSGKILVSYGYTDGEERRDVKLATMNDDGTDFRPFFAQAVPERPKDNGLRYMVFPDNRHIFLGDFVIECATALERCTKPVLLPVTYPAEVADGPHVAHRWSEIIIGPDNRHVAWTTLLANYSAVVLTGELAKGGAGYTITRPRIVSSMNPFAKDPAHADGVLPIPLLGGEVKQFVNGGRSISVVGAVRRDTPDSVVQHLDTGTREGITDTPGYTETTIFSPDERLGITMTTRFSPHTDPAILGLMPRPYASQLNMGLSMFAYTYSVTGVRGERKGNIGPALIDIAASKSTPGYLGENLNREQDWVYRSPMSWHPSSKRALWLEGKRGTTERRMRIVSLPDYAAGPAVKAQAFPETIPLSSSDLTVIPGYAKTAQDIDVKVYGRKSGTIRYRRTPAGVSEKIYDNFSDDGMSVYSGSERSEVSLHGKSTYVAKVTLTGPTPGTMDLKVTFGPLGGTLPAGIITGSERVPLSSGYVEYDGQRLDVHGLLP